ncbi:translation initiation factor IF-2-like, partial [Pipra filicauda]|uniref:Translation initiation factor IF-2-like n=1 Tax=Pipra filicauda TaxID=649802 RepID=A0A7R5K344_9PASS
MAFFYQFCHFGIKIPQEAPQKSGKNGVFLPILPFWRQNPSGSASKIWIKWRFFASSAILVSKSAWWHLKSRDSFGNFARIPPFFSLLAPFFPPFPPQAHLRQVQEQLHVQLDRVAALQEVERSQKSLLAEQEERIHRLEMERRRLHNDIQELKGNIRVFCRVRPVLPQESERQRGLHHLHFSPQDPKTLVLTRPDESHVGRERRPELRYDFSFDRVFPPGASQQEIFQEIQLLVQVCLPKHPFPPPCSSTVPKIPGIPPKSNSIPPESPPSIPNPPQNSQIPLRIPKPPSEFPNPPQNSQTPLRIPNPPSEFPNPLRIPKPPSEFPPSLIIPKSPSEFPNPLRIPKSPSEFPNP